MHVTMLFPLHCKTKEATRARQRRHCSVPEAARQRSSTGCIVSEMRKLGEENLKRLSWLCCSSCLMILFRSASKFITPCKRICCKAYFRYAMDLQ